eukprot:CAMPEP_0194264986 /NCGR_PEP_ID=MMETSP0169-20130528/341_1 /TAXON_ID=218684 /ORGANISM="Corethron pennatum, Strain L29A3" /LENGTH=841 /DNA_ID=CAMNT_0039005351 /DNA_START=305 /DNA_END=2830 /DNA_ORIENTATION=+
MSPLVNSSQLVDPTTPPPRVLEDPQCDTQLIADSDLQFRSLTIDIASNDDTLFPHDHDFSSFNQDYRNITGWPDPSLKRSGQSLKNENNNGNRIAPPPLSIRKNSIDAFLSQSPSRALGEDVFALRVSEPESLPQLPILSRGNQSGNVLPKQLIGHHQHPGFSRSISPALPSFVPSFPKSSNSMSEGGWPVNAGPLFNYSGDMNYPRAPHVPTQGAPFHANVNFSSVDTSSFPVSDDSCTHNGSNNGNVHSGQSSEMMGNGIDPALNLQMRNMSFLPPQDPTTVNSQLQIPSHQGGMFPGSLHPPAFSSRDQMHQGNGMQANASFNQTMVGNNAPGIFYMAVPMNGAQILQPVQMVQLPNGQQTFVVPSSIQSAPILQPQMSPPAQLVNGQVGIPHPGVQQPNMLVPNGISPNVLHDPQQGGASISGKKRDRRKKQPKNESQKSRSTSDHFVENGPADAITALYGSTQRPYLSDLLGNVRRLSKDQVGCRLLQQSLDEDGNEAATAIFNESLPFLADTMTDPFGNYLFQKVLEKITRDERLTLVQAVSSRLVNASLNLHGTRSVQKVVEVCSDDDAQSECIAMALAQAAARLCIDSNGNHVVQRVLQKLSHCHASFVFEAVATAVGDVARHRHGCCVIQRCLDSPVSPARSNLVAKIVENALDLMQDAYGNYVVQYVLDVCSEEEATAVCESVIGKVSLLAVQKFSSNVIEKCLEKSNDRIQELYLQEISKPENVRSLMGDPFGNYVIQRGIAVATHSQSVRLVEVMRPHLAGMRNTAGGRRIISKICRRFPKFTAELSSDPNIFTTYGPNQENVFEERTPGFNKSTSGSPPVFNSCIETE